MFHQIEDASVVLRSRGVYYQKSLFRRGRFIYAKWGNGFIRIIDRKDGTSVPNVTYEDIDLPFEIAERDSLGRPMIPESFLNQSQHNKE